MDPAPARSVMQFPEGSSLAVVAVAVLALFLAFDMLDRDDTLALARVEDADTLGGAADDADAVDGHADQLAAVADQHDLVGRFDREGGHQLADLAELGRVGGT